MTSQAANRRQHRRSRLALCCVSIPSVIAAISALGLGFLRNDCLQFPAEVLSLTLRPVTLFRSRRRRERMTPVTAGLAATAWMFFGSLPARM